MLSVVERVHAAIVDAHLDAPVVVGHSGSAGIASVYAAMHPTTRRDQRGRDDGRRRFRQDGAVARARPSWSRLRRRLGADHRQCVRARRGHARGPGVRPGDEQAEPGDRPRLLAGPVRAITAGTRCDGQPGRRGDPWIRRGLRLGDGPRSVARTNVAWLAATSQALETWSGRTAAISRTSPIRIALPSCSPRLPRGPVDSWPRRVDPPDDHSRDGRGRQAGSIGAGTRRSAALTTSLSP